MKKKDNNKDDMKYIIVEKQLTFRVTNEKIRVRHMNNDRWTHMDICFNVQLMEK